MTKSAVQAVRKTLEKSLGRIAGIKRALMFSGGFDSMLLALLAKRGGARVTAVTVQFEHFNPLTVAEATSLAQRMHVPHQVLHVTLQEFLSAFGSLPSLIDKPLLDLDLALVHAAFRKYDAKFGGKVFISGMGGDQWFGSRPLEQSGMAEWAHHQVAKAHGYKFIFPFLSEGMKTLSKQIPAALKKDKKLLRAMIRGRGEDLLPNPRSLREIQVPVQARHFLVKVYGGGEERKADDKTLWQIVQRLWLKKSRNRFFAGKELGLVSVHNIR